MIRALVLILGLVLGLGLALAVGGRVVHLRALWGGAAPVWLAGLDGDASLRAGQGRLAGGDLRWRLGGIDARGPFWRMILSGADWQGQGVARLDGVRRDGVGLAVEALRGLVPGALLVPGSRGALSVEGGALRLPLPGGALQDGWIEGQSRGLSLAGVSLDGPVRLDVENGVWRVQP